MGERFQKSAFQFLFQFARVRAAYQSHVRGDISPKIIYNFKWFCGGMEFWGANQTNSSILNNKRKKSSNVKMGHMIRPLAPY